MSYTPTGLQAMFPVYLARFAERDAQGEAKNSLIAQNENNLNQNLATLFHKIQDLEAALADNT
ncbi:MAG: hypothetical protein FWE69_02950 [Clostridiales bacterium]|nr:hypothetical protein [Clostridiales bacterium]